MMKCVPTVFTLILPPIRRHVPFPALFSSGVQITALCNSRCIPVNFDLVFGKTERENDGF